MSAPLPTPMDVDDLVARGVLRKVGRRAYVLLTGTHDLPDHISQQVYRATTTRDGLKLWFRSPTVTAKIARRRELLALLDTK